MPRQTASSWQRPWVEGEQTGSGVHGGRHQSEPESGRLGHRTGLRALGGGVQRLSAGHCHSSGKPREPRGRLWLEQEVTLCSMFMVHALGFRSQTDS